MLDTASGPTSNKLVRQALNHAIDKEAIVEYVFQGHAAVLPGQLAAGDAFGYNPNLQAYPYDPAKARELLAAAGYPNGFQTTMEVLAVAPYLNADVGTVIASYLAEVGVNANIVPLESALFRQKFYQGGRAPLFGAFTNYIPVMDTSLAYAWFTSEFSGRWYSNEKFDELFAQSNVEMDEERRRAILQELAELFHEEAPVIFLWLQGNVVATSPKIVGFAPRTDQVHPFDTIQIRQ